MARRPHVATRLIWGGIYGSFPRLADFDGTWGFVGDLVDVWADGCVGRRRSARDWVYEGVCEPDGDWASRTRCSFTVRNILDEAEDTLTINGWSTWCMRPVVMWNSDEHSARCGSRRRAGVVQTARRVRRGTGDGSLATPYTGVTSCTLPFGSRVQVLPFSHYTVQPDDFNAARASVDATTRS